MYPPPAYPPARTGPSRGWFWVALGLVVSAPLIVALSIVLNLGTIAADTDPKFVEAGGAVTIAAEKDVAYWVYQDTAAAAPGSVECRDRRTNAAVVLDPSQPFAAGDTVEQGAVTYRWIGRFTATADASVELTCPGLETAWAVQRDNNGFGWVALACCGSVTFIILGLLVLAVTATMRSRAQRSHPTGW